MREHNLTLANANRTLTTVFNSEGLFRIAVNAYASTVDDSGDTQNAVVSIVFAAATIEAVVNEIIGVSSGLLATGVYVNPKLRVFVDVEEELEAARGSIKSKLVMAKWLLSGVPIDKGSPLFQDVVALMDLRNELVHMKAVTADNELNKPPAFKEPKPLALLRSKKLLSDEGDTWFELIGTSGCALWACTTAATLAVNLQADLPSDHNFWNVIATIYDKTFRTRLTMLSQPVE